MILHLADAVLLTTLPVQESRHKSMGRVCNDASQAANVPSDHSTGRQAQENQPCERQTEVDLNEFKMTRVVHLAVSALPFFLAPLSFITRTATATRCRRDIATTYRSRAGGPSRNAIGSAHNLRRTSAQHISSIPQGTSFQTRLIERPSCTRSKHCAERALC